MNINKKTKNSIQKNLDWIEHNGWKSYDPYDFKSKPLFIFLIKRRKNFLWKILLLFFYCIFALTPKFARRLFKTKPSISAGGIAFLASAYINIYKNTNDIKKLEKAKKLLDWLDENKIKKEKKYCWGLPFAWETMKHFPKNTPIGYTTAECVKPFLEYYKITSNKKSLKIIISACEFLSENLNKTKHEKNTISISYTPLDDSMVYNINAIISEVLMNVGQIAKREDFQLLAKKIMKFVINKQNKDGGWYYSFQKKNIDNYHTAMTLQALYNFIKLVKNLSEKEKYINSLIKGLSFYLEKMFDNHQIPKNRTNKKYPIDIASCAEAIILFSKIQNNKQSLLPIDLYKKIKETNRNLTKWTIDNMQEKSGAFIFRKYRFKKIKLYSIRWGQAFMLNALSLFYGTNQTKNEKR